MKTTIIKVCYQRYTTKELAVIYNCAPRTMRKLLAAIKELLGPRKGHQWSVEQVQIIFSKYTPPYQIIEHETEIADLIPMLNQTKGTLVELFPEENQRKRA